MKKLLSPLFVGMVALSAAAPAQAHVLVFKFQLLSSVVVGPTGTTTRIGNSAAVVAASPSSLLLLDLDTDFVRESEENGSAVERITIDEKNKAFKHALPGEGKTVSRSTKFEFFNNSKNFYLFTQDFEKFGAWGTDHGAIATTGTCNLKVDIGGGKTSSVPKNFTATQYRGDSQEFKTNVFTVSYDSVLTKAVNEQLVAAKVKSTKGSEVSLSIPYATSWLIKTYLPNGYPKPFPAASKP